MVHLRGLQTTRVLVVSLQPVRELPGRHATASRSLRCANKILRPDFNLAPGRPALQLYRNREHLASGWNLQWYAEQLAHDRQDLLAIAALVLSAYCVVDLLQ